MKKEKGFTLLELLATILIVSMVLGIAGYFVMNTMDNSKNKANELTLASAKSSLELYIKEYPDEITWMNIEETEPSSQLACISIQSLINKGYINEKEWNNSGISSEYIKVIRDENKMIIQKELDETNVCGTSKTKVALPTSKEYCLNPVYDPASSIDNPAILTKTLDENAKIEFSNNTGVDAGNYTVTVKLKDEYIKVGYIWEDGSKNEKEIVCTIKKKAPELYLEPPGETGEIGTSKVSIKSDTTGNISLKTSNKEIATASVEGKNIEANIAKELTIEKYATRKANTYITVTLTPTDIKNYYTKSSVYTIGEVTKKQVKKPDENLCTNPVYTGANQYITKTLTGSEGYLLYGNFQKEADKKYTVTAKLKYGYTWEGGGVEDVAFTCYIKQPVIVTYEGNKFSTVKQVSNGLTIDYDPSTSYLTLNGTYNSTGGLVLMDLGSQKFVSGDNYKISLTHISGSYTKSASGVFVTDIKKASNVSLSARNYADTAFPTRNATTTNSLIVNSIGANEGKDLVVWLWQSAANSHVFNNYKIKVTITKVETAQEIYKEKYKGFPSTNPTRLGYSFNNWYTSEIGGNNVTTNTEVTNKENHTLYAHWTVNTYTITYNSNGGTACTPNSKTVTYGSAYGTLCTPTRTGYNFTGWYTATSGGNKIETTTNVATASDHTLYARWTAKTITITYNKNGGSGTMSNTTYTYGSSGNVFATNKFTRTGYTFSYWTMYRPADDKWYGCTDNSVACTGSAGNTTIGWYSQSQIKLYYTPSGSNWEFSGYLTDSDITLYAQWKINVCTINFNANGGSFASGASTVKTLNYGSSWTNLWNVLGSSGHFNATAPSGYTKIKDDLAWMNNSTKAKYSQASNVTYKATDFCPNLASGNQTITLYANWYRRQKRTYDSCIKGSNTCKGGYLCKPGNRKSCMTVYKNKTECQRMEGSSATWENGECCTYVYDSCATTYYSNCATGSNTCKAGWTSWTTVSSCSASSTVKCRNDFKLTQ